MSDDLVKPLDGKALLIEAVVDRYGERCRDYQAGCACCDAWRHIDHIKELEAKLAKAVEALSEIAEYKLSKPTRHFSGHHPADEIDATVPASDAEYLISAASDTLAELTAIKGGE